MTTASAGRAESRLEVRPFRVLYLAFSFPPLDGGGVQRAAKFAKYLPEFGFDPVVVTGPAEQRTRHAPVDVSLRSEKLPASRICRVAGAFRKISGRIRSGVGRADRAASPRPGSPRARPRRRAPRPRPLPKCCS